MDFSQNTSFSGLSTSTFIAPADGNYKIEGSVTVPSARDAQAASQVVVTINVNASPIYVGPPGAQGFKVVRQLLTTDTLTVVLSSSADVDQPKNVIKSTLAISAGE